MSKNEPSKARIYNGYETQNLNKTAYLLINGAVFKGCRVDQKGMSTFILDNVNKRHRDEFWEDDVKVELWTYVRMRKFLKEKVKQKITSKQS